MGQEIELKLLLDGEPSLARLAEAARRRGAHAAPPAHQQNHFFDTPAGELRARDAVVRLRDEDGRFVLAAKGAAEAGAGGELVHRRVELELDLTPEEAGAILDGRADPLARLESGLEPHPLLASLRATAGERALVPAGSFRNRRTRVGPLEVAGHPLHLELDRTELPGDVVHCEVELEVPAGLERAAGELLEELLAEARVRGAPASSKAARFFRALAAGRGASPSEAASD